MPPQQEYRIRGEIVSRSSYYRFLQRNRDDNPSSSNSLEGNDSPPPQTTISPSSSSPSSIAPMATLGNFKSPSSSLEGIAVDMIRELSPQRGNVDSEYVTEVMDLPSTIGFLDGKIP